MSAKPLAKLLFLLLSALILSVSTVVFGALPMRAIRRAHGRLIFWGTLVPASALMIFTFSPSYGLLVLALTVAVGIYAEVEEHGGTVFTSAFVATLAALGVATVGIGIWVYQSKVMMLEALRSHITPLVERLTALNSNSAINVDTILQQLPSGLIIGLILAVAISLIAEARLGRWIGLQNRKAVAQAPRLVEFRVPDIFVWLAIATIFGAFFRHGNAVVETASLNALNVLVVVFFFQGLAIVAHAFSIYRISPFWQWLWYLVLVAQLSLLVSLVGFVDFWMEFRERLTRKPAETNKGT